jgi:hypothetical protein
MKNKSKDAILDEIPSYYRLRMVVYMVTTACEMSKRRSVDKNNCSDLFRKWNEPRNTFCGRNADLAPTTRRDYHSNH